MSDPTNTPTYGHTLRHSMRISSAKARAPLFSPELWLVVLLGLNAILPVSINLGLNLLVLVWCLVLTYEPRLWGESLKPIYPLVIVFSLGAIFCCDNIDYDVYKDIWYSAKPIICFSLGFVFASRLRKFGQFCTFYIYLSFILSIIYLVQYALSPHEALDASYDTSGLNIVTAFALPLLLKFGRKLISNSIFRFAIISSLLAALALRFSRTDLFCSVLATAALFNLYKNARNVVLAVLLICTVAFLLAVFVNTSDNPNSHSVFYNKVLNSINEISPLAVTTPDDVTMRKDWRGYEATMAWQQFQDISFLKKLVGQGWGATVDLEQTISITREISFRYLLILHNGYFQILTKYGIIGLLFYLYFLFNIVMGRSPWTKAEGRLMSELRLGTGLIIAFTTLVITGPFNKSNLNSIMIFAGMLYGYSFRVNRMLLKRPRRVAGALGRRYAIADASGNQ
jgi:hypothetical protein